MPFRLDSIDEAILESLSKDGRKSFRQISREIKVSTPTVKARYERLVNIGLIKAVLPIIDTGKLEKSAGKKIENIRTDVIKNRKIKLSQDMLVKMTCDYCNGLVAAKPTVLKFGNYERFFCCTSCRSLYKEKYRGRIESLSNQ
ncbi:AsnC family transcriptional regulator [Candidatus Nitrosotenuis uzonensis]|uniref:Transcriptional regulator, AsnC family n=1 Tax=Candidatus Nitrosotenuis uzonensis TaxID=1407055 RepID=V6AU81_9ARCH|nr:AsnC family transcriptional regulator [Candidatus Nitrosotenuis uzonensis]CDI06336.1 putative transcriptional regulator, AsnC family [Candidatus Nitrosotenuis uzonensis]